MNTQSNYPASSMVFKIFVDVAGMYRWLLIDDVGQRVQRSVYGFAGLAAAWNDAEARLTDFPGARIDASQFSA